MEQRREADGIKARRVTDGGDVDHVQFLLRCRALRWGRNATCVPVPHVARLRPSAPLWGISPTGSLLVQ